MQKDLNNPQLILGCNWDYPLHCFCEFLKELVLKCGIDVG